MTEMSRIDQVKLVEDLAGRLKDDCDRIIEADMEGGYDDMIPNTMLDILNLIATVASDEVAMRFAFIMNFHEMQWNDPEWEKYKKQYDRHTMLADEFFDEYGESNK